MMHNCDWCGRAAQTKTQTTPKDVSHGICAVCLAEMLQEVFGLGRKKEEARPPLPPYFERACAAV